MRDPGYCTGQLLGSKKENGNGLNKKERRLFEVCPRITFRWRERKVGVGGQGRGGRQGYEKAVKNARSATWYHMNAEAYATLGGGRSVYMKCLWIKGYRTVWRVQNNRAEKEIKLGQSN